MRSVSGLVRRGKRVYIYHFTFTKNRRERRFLDSRITEIQLHRNNELVMHFFKGQWLKYSKDKEVKELYNSLIRKYLKA